MTGREDELSRGGRGGRGQAGEDPDGAPRAGHARAAPAARPPFRSLPHAPATPAAALGAGPGPAEPVAPRAPFAAAPRRRRQERAVAVALALCSAVSVLTTVGIVAVLVVEAASFFAEVSPLEFLTGTRWTPMFRPQEFGVLPLLCGSLLVAAGAALVALPIGLASAIYLSEYAHPRVRRVLKPSLEVLAGVPTVIYGYFALTFVTPLLRQVWPGTQVFNAASASIVVGIMIIPMVSSLAEDAMSAVPRSLREAAYALGATKLEVSTRTVVPAALSGILAAFILALSRAIGETMIVTIAAGATPNLTLNPLEGVQTMTAYIAQVSLGETPFGTIEYRTIFAVGLALFAITLLMNVASMLVLRRFREVYE